MKQIIFVLVCMLLLGPAALKAQETPAPKEPQPEYATEASSQPTMGDELGYGFGSALASLLYSPAKVTYAGLGLLTGGVGFVLSGGNAEVAGNIINPAVRGNYVVTPDHLKRKEPLIFVGPRNP